MSTLQPPTDPELLKALSIERPIRSGGLLMIYTSRYDGGDFFENINAGRIPREKERFEKMRKAVRFVQQNYYPCSHYIEGHGWVATHETVDTELDRYDPPVRVPLVQPMQVPFQFNDGGRAQVGRKGHTGDCVTRAVAIAARRPYEEVYQRMAEGNASQRRSRRERRSTKRTGRRTASHGIFTRRKWFDDYMRELGFEWTPTMKIGSGCKVHLRPEELPGGRLIVSVSKHMVAVIDGVVHDTYDPSRSGTRCVYGYYSQAAA